MLPRRHARSSRRNVPPPDTRSASGIARDRRRRAAPAPREPRRNLPAGRPTVDWKWSYLILLLWVLAVHRRPVYAASHFLTKRRVRISAAILRTRPCVRA